MTSPAVFMVNNASFLPYSIPTLRTVTNGEASLLLALQTFTRFSLTLTHWAF